MNPVQYNSSITSIISIALITVNIDARIADNIADSVFQMSWNVHRADCEGYISSVKRPPFSQPVKSATACIAVIDFDKDIEQAVIAAAYLQELYSGKAALIALSTSQDPDITLRAMRAGCNELIGREFDGISFSDTLSRLYLQWSAKSEQKFTQGKVVTLFGAKGGVGTTTLAVHLAMYMVVCHKKKTLLIDNHPELGHACIHLGIDGSRYHFQELVRNINRLDSDLLRGYIATHESGLEVLSSPDICSGMKTLDPDSITQTLDFLRGEYDYVIVDNTSSLDEANLAVIDASSHVYIVAAPDIAAIRDLSRYIDSLSQNNHDVDKIKVVINRFSSKQALTIEQIEKAIRLPVAIKLPNGYAEVTHSAILGEPMSPKKKTGFTTSIVKWANALADTAVPTEAGAPQRSWFSLWK